MPNTLFTNFSTELKEQIGMWFDELRETSFPDNDTFKFHFQRKSRLQSLLEILAERRSQTFYKRIDVHSVTNATGQIYVSMIFLVVTFFVGKY